MKYRRIAITNNDCVQHLGQPTFINIFNYLQNRYEERLSRNEGHIQFEN